MRRFINRAQGIAEFAVLVAIVAALFAGVFALAHVFPEVGEEAVDQLSEQPERTGEDPEDRTKRPPHNGVIASYAIFSEDDNSLRFYKDLWNEIPYEGDTFRGYKVTRLYLDVEEKNFTSEDAVSWREIADQVEIVEAMNPLQPWHMNYWFSGMTSLVDCKLENFDASISDSFYATFKDCSSLEVLDISRFDIRSARTCAYMFAGCSKITMLNPELFMSNSLQDASHMFEDCGLLTELYLPDTFTCSNVRNFTNMFYDIGCDSIAKWELDISYLDLTNATETDGMLGKSRNIHMWQLTLGENFKKKPFDCGLRDYERPGDLVMLTDGYWYDTPDNDRKLLSEDVPAGAGVYQIRPNLYGIATVSSSRTGTVTKTTTETFTGTLTCSLSDFPPNELFSPRYQWYLNDAPISGANSVNCDFSVGISGNANATNEYYCRITDGSGHWEHYVQSNSFVAKKEPGATDWQVTWTANRWNRTSSVVCIGNPYTNSTTAYNSMVNRDYGGYASGTYWLTGSRWYYFWNILYKTQYDSWTEYTYRTTNGSKSSGGSALSYPPANTTYSWSTAYNGFVNWWNSYHRAAYGYIRSYSRNPNSNSAYYQYEGTGYVRNGTTNGSGSCVASTQEEARNLATAAANAWAKPWSGGEAVFNGSVTGIGTPQSTGIYYDFSFNVE